MSSALAPAAMEVSCGASVIIGISRGKKENWSTIISFRIIKEQEHWLESMQDFLEDSLEGESAPQKPVSPPQKSNKKG